VSISDFGAVVQAARRGDHRAQAVLYREYAPTVLGYARGSQARDPEDVTSEVFVAVVRGLAGFDGDEPAFRSWLFTIAHHRVVDERRGRARRTEDATDPVELAGRTAAWSTPDDAALVDPVASAHLRAALESLTDEQREVVLLRILADLPIAEVAELLGKNEGAVKMLQRRALAALARDVSTELVA
jgi:RNA polymerase sigma-70 factor, ECF subfamily